MVADFVDGCSGIACWNIYVFTEKEGSWQCLATADARLKSMIEVDVDAANDRLIFYTTDGQIGELALDRLNLEDGR